MQVERYDVQWRIDPSRERFDGDATIRFAHDGGEIELDSIGLEIDGAELDGRPVESRTGPAPDRLRLGPAPAGARTLRLRFRGPIPTGSLVGIYRSRFGDGQIVTTMCYPTGCARLLPCFDRPDLKAVFRVSVEVGADDEVVFNTLPESVVALGGGRKRIAFAPTPRMPTYLLYLAVGPIESVEAEGPGPRVLVALPRGRAESGRSAARHGARLLRGFEEYYQIPYPLPKLHLIGIADFWAGAMENWGAISFHERFLVESPRTSTWERLSTIETISHEIAHQWFGDLVTMRWWDDFWLNESFATHAGYAMVDRLGLAPGAVWGTFFRYWASRALRSDSLVATHPVRVEVHSPTEISEIADLVTYGKGASVLRMIEGFVGPEAYRRGVTRYLRTFAYGNARSEDLWHSLEAETREPVARVMAEWLARPGHPRVDVERVGGGLRLSQRRFRLDGEAEAGVWPVPLRLRVGADVRSVLFDREQLRLDVPTDTPIEIDPDRHGFYRVRYRGELEAEAERRFSEWTPRGQSRYLQDAWSFLLAGELPYERYAGLVTRTQASLDPDVVGEVGDQLARLLRILSDDGEFVALARSWLVAQTDRLLAIRDSDVAPSDAMLGGYLARARLLVDPDFARSRAARFASIESVGSELRVATAQAFARSGGPDALAVLFERLREAAAESDALQWLEALAWLPGPEAAAALDRAHSSGMPSTRLRMLLESMTKNAAAHAPLWEWIAAHLADLDRAFAGTPLLSFVLEPTLAYVGPGRSDPSPQVFEPARWPAAQRGLKRGIELRAIHEKVRQRRGLGPRPSRGSE